jgi:hypothetical protein
VSDEDRTTIELTDAMIVNMWVATLRQVAADDEIDYASVRRLLGSTADVIEALMERISILEADLFHAGPGTPTIGVHEPEER